MDSHLEKGVQGSIEQILYTEILIQGSMQRTLCFATVALNQALLNLCVVILILDSIQKNSHIVPVAQGCILQVLYIPAIFDPGVSSSLKSCKCCPGLTVIGISL